MRTVVTPEQRQADRERSAIAHKMYLELVREVRANCVVHDWEKPNTWRSSAGRKITLCSRGEFLAGKLFKKYPNRLHVIEAPHMQGRNGQSLAQPYTPEELAMLYAVATQYGVTIEYFGAKSTTRASREAGNGTEVDSLDKNGRTIKRWIADGSKDSDSIRKFLINHPEIPTMKWKNPDARSRATEARRDAIRKDCSYRLNEMRATDPTYSGAEVDRAIAAIDFIDDHVSDDTADWFKMVTAAGNLTNFTVKSNRERVKHIMSVWVVVFNEDGTLRKNDRGTFMGVDEALAVLWMHNFHGRGGTARSNLVFWNLRIAESALTPTGVRARDMDTRRSFSKAVKQMIQALRDYGEKLEGLNT